MAVFCALLFLTLPSDGQGGNFFAFFGVFMVRSFLTAGLGSASTFQMISVIFRKLTMDRVKAQGGSEEQAMREAATDTALRPWALSRLLAQLAASLFRKRSASRLT